MRLLCWNLNTCAARTQRAEVRYKRTLPAPQDFAPCGCDGTNVSYVQVEIITNLAFSWCPGSGTKTI